MGMFPDSPIVPGWPNINLRLDHQAQPDDCWLVTPHSGDGYARVSFDNGRTSVLAHRVSWEVHNGRTIPKDHAVHHECHQRNCVNPRHLTLLSAADHQAIHHPPTDLTRPPDGDCRHGHDWATHGHVTTQRRWICLTCQREAGRRHDAKRRPRRANTAPAGAGAVSSEYFAGVTVC